MQSNNPSTSPFLSLTQSVSLHISHRSAHRAKSANLKDMLRTCDPYDQAQLVYAKLACSSSASPCQATLANMELRVCVSACARARVCKQIFSSSPPPLTTSTSGERLRKKTRAQNHLRVLACACVRARAPGSLFKPPSPPFAILRARHKNASRGGKHRKASQFQSKGKMHFCGVGLKALLACILIELCIRWMSTDGKLQTLQAVCP